MADASFRKVFLDTHNEYRRNHSTPGLTMSTELNNAAQRWANHLLSIGQLKHSSTNDGENVYSISSSVPIKLTGHFTQVVWKDSTEVGVGMATNGKTAFVVGQYRRAGNMSGGFQKNVLPKV